MPNKLLTVVILSAMMALIGTIDLVHAEEVKGVVVSINYDDQYAFTDLSHEFLEEGDRLRVYTDGQFVGYLVVTETSTTVSRLAVEENADSSFFKLVILGSTVTKQIRSGQLQQNIPRDKLDLAEKKFSETMSSLSDIKDKYGRMNQNYQKLEQESQQLRLQNEEYQKEIQQLKDKQIKLEEHLKQLNALVEEGLKTYE
ncbi:MAG: hypothetical protein KC684_07470 [Candidatus Omnitrophica bacterium]|nr:hypothetical protein [Candidatus Omnitrophota bacterium]